MDTSFIQFPHQPLLLAKPEVTMAVGSSLTPLDASKLKIKAHDTPKPVPDVDSPELASLKVSTDRMVVAN